MLFPISLSNNHIVYMQGEIFYGSFVVIAEMDKFLSHVHTSVYFELEHSNIKYQNCTKSFDNSKAYPIPLSRSGMFYDYEKDGKRSFCMGDGITRIQFLKDNGAKYFPIFCPIYQFREFLSKIGRFSRPITRPVRSSSEVLFREF